MNVSQSHSNRGKVYLVGAGPGDPGLITVRGRQCLELADVVLYDGLANPQLLLLAPQAECISVGKHGQTPIWTQADINAKLVTLAAQGRVVVRLKGGDPAVFARTAEELEVLAEAGVAFEVVPGITAALAAASYVGIPITHRQHASAVAFVTGQQQAGGTPQQLDWDALARFPGTLVFYMGVTTVEEWTTQLLAAGKNPQTPVAIVRRCTWSDQSVVRCTLGDVVDQFHRAGRVRPPVIVIVGEVASLGTNFDWFSQRPLHGCGVLVTRTHEQSSELIEQLQARGAEVFSQPVIECAPPSSFNSLDTAIEEIKQGQVRGLTFSSTNGVDGFFDRLANFRIDARGLAGMRLAAVGPATAARLRHYGVLADVIPPADTGFSAEGLLASLETRLDGERWIVTTTNRSSETLTRGLKLRGAQVSEALSYETRLITSLRPDIVTAIEAGRIQYVTVTSSFVAEACGVLLSQYFSRLHPLSLSGKISDVLVNMGWPASAQAEHNTSAALVQALEQCHRAGSS